MRGVIALVAGFSDRIVDGRSLKDIMAYLKDEMVELEEEIETNDPGEDGIFGEAVDVMINCIDLIRKERPLMSLDEIDREVERYAEKKCLKWQRKAGGAA